MQDSVGAGQILDRHYGGPRYTGPGPNTGGPVANNRQIDASPIGQALAGLEESTRALHSTVTRHGERLELVMQPPPPSPGDAEKAREPVTVMERITAAEAMIRFAQARLEMLSDRLLL